MEIKRDRYLNKLTSRELNGSVKVITGIRRCGKSYLLFHLFKDCLLGKGVPKDHIIEVALDDIKNKHLRDPGALYDFISRSVGDGQYYVFLDEIQYVDGFEDAVNGLRHIDNLDIYITGSNSKFLSKDVITEFRGRGDQVEVRPLSFSEFASAYPGDRESAWDAYRTYGGMPEIISKKTEEEKTQYLQKLMNEVYLRDIVERNRVELEDVLGLITDSLCSAVGSMTNPLRICNTLGTLGYKRADNETVSKYIGYLTDSFLFEKSRRYDIKGRKYFDTPSKYYAADAGLRNARLNFRQQEYTHIMENIVYNELRSRGFLVDIGVIETTAKKDGVSERKRLEIDFVANKGSKKYYIQSAYSIPDREKADQEIRPFLKVRDSFKKIVITGDRLLPQRDENGILTMNILDFLLNEDSLDI
ncbi:MAG: ATP-binding protein [Candidatus Methanoplasma sp.]|jgi:predicted AAA+ superfamily ATPase|nr:ATP-binding protein [Candidatus Methanoplasma sp.]